MMNIRSLYGLGCFFASLAFVTSVSAAEPTKIGFVYVGPVADAGWTYEHDRGRLAVEKEYGDKVETVFVESVSEGPDAELVISQMAADGANMIFTQSFATLILTFNAPNHFPISSLNMPQE